MFLAIENFGLTGIRFDDEKKNVVVFGVELLG